MQRGQVKWYDEQRGFGFIRAEVGDRDVFVYSEDIVDKGERVLKPGEWVKFEITEAAQGPRAVNVQRELASVKD